MLTETNNFKLSVLFCLFVWPLCLVQNSFEATFIFLTHIIKYEHIFDER